MAFKQEEVEQLLVNTGRRCCICHNYHNVSAHHIFPISEGGTDNIDNAITLCPNCHDVVHEKSTLTPGSTTRNYTSNELKLHRDNLIKLIREGTLDNPTAVHTTHNDDKRFEMIIQDYKLRGTPKYIIDSFTDLTIEQKAEYFDRAVIFKKGRLPKDNPYRK